MDDVDGLFENDSMLPIQFYAGREKLRHYEPERRLLAAILEDAVRCWDHLWLFGSSSAPFSFDYVCNALDLDPAWMRRRLFEQGKDRKITRRSPVWYLAQPAEGYITRRRARRQAANAKRLANPLYSPPRSGRPLSGPPEAQS